MSLSLLAMTGQEAALCNVRAEVFTNVLDKYTLFQNANIIVIISYRKMHSILVSMLYVN